MRPPDGHQADRRIGRAEQTSVERVGAHPGHQRGQPLLHDPAFQLEAVGGEAQGGVVADRVRRQGVVRGDEAAERGNHDGGGLLGGLGGGLERGPEAAVARQREAGEAEIQDVLHRGRVEDRHHHAFEDVLGLVRIGGGLCAVVIPGDRQHAAQAVGAQGVGAAERVARAIDAGPLAVPHAEDAADPGAGEGLDLLRAPQHGGGHVLVQPGLETDVVRGEEFLPAPQFQIEPAERGTAIARHQPASALAGRAIQPRLFQQHANQRLDTGEQDRLVELDVAAVEGQRGARQSDIHGIIPPAAAHPATWGRWGVPGRSAKRRWHRRRSSPFPTRCCAAHRGVLIVPAPPAGTNVRGFAGAGG